MYKNIRYQQRRCTDQAKIDQFLTFERTGTLGMVENGAPYAVPLNFVWSGGCIYFHGMGRDAKEAS